MESIARSIHAKLKKHRIKVSTVISCCEKIDINEDDLIHIGDLENVLNDLLGQDSLSRRETNYILACLGTSKSSGKIRYKRFFELFTENYDTAERWETGSDNDEDTRWATKRGSVGEWLKNAACPAEIKNFKKFIACLEEFERNSGMKCQVKENGFIVPLGPDLKASINFVMK